MTEKNLPANVESNGIAMLKSMKTRIEQVLPSFIGPERFLQIVMQEFRKTPKLLQCTTDSLMAGLMRSAKEGLEVGEECYMIPRKNGDTGKLECVYQRSYVGVLTLARRSGEFSNIAAGIVHEKDRYELLEGTENRLTISRTLTDRGKPLFYWCATQIKGGESSFTVISVRDAEEHRDKFAATKKVWNQHFDSMALKTVIMRHLKYQPRSYDRHMLAAEDRVLTLSDNGIDTVPIVETPQVDEDTGEVIDGKISDINDEIKQQKARGKNQTGQQITRPTSAGQEQTNQPANQNQAAPAPPPVFERNGSVPQQIAKELAEIDGKNTVDLIDLWLFKHHTRCLRLHGETGWKFISDHAERRRAFLNAEPAPGETPPAVIVERPHPAGDEGNVMISCPEAGGREIPRSDCDSGDCHINCSEFNGAASANSKLTMDV